jgi:predicted transcriptional regulator
VANLTLKIDDNLLKKARRMASRRETSVNAIVRRSLEEFVSSDLNLQAAIKGLDSFYSRCKARVGRKTWTRDDVHER